MLDLFDFEGGMIFASVYFRRRHHDRSSHLSHAEKSAVLFAD